MRNQDFRCFFSNKFLSCFTDCKGIGLREKVGHQFIMIADWIVGHCEWLLWLCEANELNWSSSSLMKKLEEAMLTICARFSEIDYCSLVRDYFSFWVYSLPIALHVKLLDVRCEFAKSLAIWNNSSWCVTLNGSSEESDKTKKKRNIFLYW